VSNQIVLEIPLGIVLDEVEANVSKLFHRNAKDIGIVAKHRNVSHNQPVLAGTRIRVSSVQSLAEDGYSVDQILSEYPSLERKDVEAALEYKETA
jgi:uncharacterized protein (DUF433 family)